MSQLYSAGDWWLSAGFIHTARASAGLCHYSFPGLNVHILCPCSCLWWLFCPSYGMHLWRYWILNTVQINLDTSAGQGVIIPILWKPFTCNYRAETDARYCWVNIHSILYVTAFYHYLHLINMVIFQWYVHGRRHLSSGIIHEYYRNFRDPWRHWYRNHCRKCCIQYFGCRCSLRAWSWHGMFVNRN